VRTADFTASRNRASTSFGLGSPDSPAFHIRTDVYNASLRLIMVGFYGQRCGVPVSLEHDGIRYEYGACHLSDGYLDYYDPAGKARSRTAPAAGTTPATSASTRSTPPSRPASC